jgi:hypothetical protein
MTMRTVDPTTGMLAGQWCPVTERQFFKPGTEPQEICNVHTEPPVEEPVFDPDSQIFIPGAPSPVQKGVEGIGKVLRKIFRF